MNRMCYQPSKLLTTATRPLVGLTVTEDEIHHAAYKGLEAFLRKYITPILSIVFSNLSVLVPCYFCNNYNYTGFRLFGY